MFILILDNINIFAHLHYNTDYKGEFNCNREYYVLDKVF